MAPRARSAGRPARDRSDDGIDSAGFRELPRGCRRWWPQPEVPAVCGKLRKEVRAAIPRQPQRNTFSMWQMNFPQELPSGFANPVCSLGECGDPSCPTFRPKRPEVREAVERFILEKCKSHFRAGALHTYASVGCGLLGQDWIVLEKLREEGLLPKRAIFVELRTAKPVMSCEGADFPRLSAGGGVNLRQTGFCGPLGPEFAFCASVRVDGQPTGRSFLFDFANEGGGDAISVQVAEAGVLHFGAGGHSMKVEECWEPGKTQAFLFSISAVGMYNVFRDGELIARSYGPAPRTCPRRHLWVGQAATGNSAAAAFRGRIQKIKVWDQEVDTLATDMMYSHEVDTAHQAIAQWYKNEVAIWSFGSLASYAAACEKEKQFAADVLLKIDVHEELDGYDDFVCKALAPEGLALTLGGPGRSWRRSGEGWLPVDTKVQILDSAEEKVLVPWAFLGAFPGDQGRPFFAKACPAQRAECAESRRSKPKERRRLLERRRGGAVRRSLREQKARREDRWYGMTDEASGGLALVPQVSGLSGSTIERLLEELDLLRADPDDEELPGLLTFNR